MAAQKQQKVPAPDVDAKDCKWFTNQFLYTDIVKWVHTYDVHPHQNDYKVEVWTAWLTTDNKKYQFILVETNPNFEKKVALWAELHVHPGADSQKYDVIRIKSLSFEGEWNDQKRVTVMQDGDFRLPLHSSDLAMTAVDECNIYMNGKKKQYMAEKVGIYNEKLVKSAQDRRAGKDLKLENVKYKPNLKESVHLFPEFDTYYQHEPRPNYLYSPTDGTTTSVLSVLIVILLCAILCLCGAAIGCIGGFSIRHIMGKWNKRDEPGRKDIAYRSEEI